MITGVMRGAAGWGYADVLPYFRRMETAHCGQTPWRGIDGPLHITRGPRDNPLHEAFVKAATQAGYATTSDYNGHRQEGFGPADMTVWKGRRWSTANAYLNLPCGQGVLNCLSARWQKKFLFDGYKAIGVRVTSQRQTDGYSGQKGCRLICWSHCEPSSSATIRDRRCWSYFKSMVLK